MNTPFQKEFRALVDAADTCCQRRFGGRLAASYVAGSVATGEAWPGASDLDWFMFLDGPPTAADVAWQKRKQRELGRRFPVVSHAHLNVYDIERLRAEPFWRFILRYNGVRVAGRDLLRELRRAGQKTPRPGRKLAKARLPFVRQCLAELAAGRYGPGLGSLPADACLASRKLARNFVLVEGAHVLMARGRFESFRQEAVLAGLRRISRRWQPLLRTTEAILNDPPRAGVRGPDFMRMVRPFVEWGIQTIERSTS